MATTIGELRGEVLDNLSLEDIDPPNVKRVTRALNRAKNEVVALLELIEPLRFIARLDYTVASGDTYIDLPGYGDQSEETKWRRILGLARVEDSSYETDIPIYDRRDQGLKSSPGGFWMYREGNKLYFSTPTGASTSCTLRLRYSVLVSDATEGSGVDLDATYGSYIPDDWTDLLVTRATLFLLPARGDVAGKYERMWSERKASLMMAANRTVHDRPMHVKMVDEWC